MLAKCTLSADRERHGETGRDKKRQGETRRDTEKRQGYIARACKIYTFREQTETGRDSRVI